jgi:hypothetical protein
MRDYRAGGEQRVVDPTSGGEKGAKPVQLGSLDPVGLEEMGRVGGYGATKYARYNFIKGYAYSLSVDAMFRHMLAWLGGEDFDPESGLHHMAHAAWHGHALVGFQQRGVGTDDRPPRVERTLDLDEMSRMRTAAMLQQTLDRLGIPAEKENT